jgi:hypothetical protein
MTGQDVGRAIYTDHNNVNLEIDFGQ